MTMNDVSDARASTHYRAGVVCGGGWLAAWVVATAHLPTVTVAPVVQTRSAPELGCR
jgi:hypothetical protein